MVMGSLRQETQLVVIGAGPGGYVAAIRAADLSKEVLVVEERENLGGVCLLEGCIPSKTLINAAELIESALAAKKIGIEFPLPGLDLDALRAWKQSVVQGLSQGVASLLKARGIEVIKGRARFEGPHKLAIEGGDVSGIDFREAILATGSRPRPLDTADGVPYWTSKEALDLPSIPGHLIVVGGGYIGLELGQVFAGLGSKVTVVEFSTRLLAGPDADLTEIMLKVVTPHFAEVLTESKVVGLAKTAAGVAVTVEHAGQRRTLEADQLLVATGRLPNTEGLGLEKLGLRVNQSGRIPVNEQGQTSLPHIYAIGDIVPGPMLAHKASREAKVAAESLAGRKSAFDNRAIPAVVYTDPEIAWTGLTEFEVKRGNRPYKVGRFPMRALGRARTLGRTEGMVKIITDPESDLILGVGMVGLHASELIAEATLALEMGATLEDLLATIHPHPTMSESILEAAEVAAGTAVHLPAAKK